MTQLEIINPMNNSPQVLNDAELLQGPLKPPTFFGAPPAGAEFGARKAYNGFVSSYEFSGELQSAPVTGRAVGIIVTNPNLLTKIIKEKYATGYDIKTVIQPSDPSLVVSLWSDDLNDFTSSIQSLKFGVGGLPWSKLQYHVETDATSFGTLKVTSYSMLGKTLLTNPISLASYITASDYNKNIAEFMLGLSLMDNLAVVFEAAPVPAVGAASILTVILQVGT